MKNNNVYLTLLIFVLCSCFEHKNNEPNYIIEDISHNILSSYYNNDIERIEDEKIYSRYYKISSDDTIYDSLRLFKKIFFISKIYPEIEEDEVDFILIIKDKFKLKDGSSAYLFKDEIASNSGYMGANQLFICREKHVTQLIFDDYKIDESIITESNLRDKTIKKKYVFDKSYKFYLNKSPLPHEKCHEVDVIND